jgi:CheY-like chemotaxis protein
MTTILVVDDEYAVADFLKTVLEEEGYHVLVAENGREGLARLAESRPALVLCDLMMPIMDGAALCRAMRKNPDYQAIPFVLMSARHYPPSRDDEGCNYTAFLAKPFSLDKLIELVSRLVGMLTTTPTSPHDKG